MKIMDSIYTTSTGNEYGTDFKYFTVAMLVMDNNYLGLVTTQIRLQKADEGYYFAPSIETSRGLDSFADFRREFAEDWLIKEYKKYMARTSKKVWEMGADMHNDKAIHINNFLQGKKVFQKCDTWEIALEAARKIESDQNKKLFG